jgi:hypothetical protein
LAVGVSYDGYTHGINPNAAELTTIERKGRCEEEQPKVGPKGELSGRERVKERRAHRE